MKNYGLYIALLMLFSCGGAEEEKNPLNFEDFAGDTGTEDDTDTTESFEFKIFNTPTSELGSKMISSYDTLFHKEFHPLDRFGFNQSEKLRFNGKEKVEYGSSMVTPKADFFYYSFADTNKTINAFYNYLDVMSEEGEGGPVKLLEDVEYIKTPPLFMIVYDTVIVTAKYKCEHESNNWNAFQDSVLQVFGKDYRYQIDVYCGGPLKWK